MERVLSNLLSNAIKYSPLDGQIEVSLARQEEQGRASAIVSIHDEGLGIPATDMAHIFEPFHRASNVVGKFTGTGLGLSSVAQMVKLHGGTITVDSHEREGSTFTVSLPLTVDDLEEL
jgi:signal transduction histidine kinase